MQKHLITLIALSAALAPSTSNAALVIYEGFDYVAGANGNNAQNGGTGFTAAWDNGNADISAGSMAYTDGGGRSLITSGNRLFADASGVSPTVGTTISPFRSIATAMNGVVGSTLYISFMGQQLSGAGFLRHDPAIGIQLPVDFRDNPERLPSFTEAVRLVQMARIPCGQRSMNQPGCFIPFFKFQPAKKKSIRTTK